MNRKTYPATLSVSRPQGGLDGKRHINIRIEDRMSGTLVVDLYISLAQFSEAITGLACRPCEVDWDVDKLLKKKEHKHEIVDRPDLYDKKEDAKRILSEHEVDGWVGSIESVTNPHNWTNDNKVRASFVRFVEATEADIEGRRNRNKEEDY